jgi:hypothetical protein
VKPVAPYTMMSNFDEDIFGFPTSRHCEEHLRRSNPFFLRAVAWIASRSLSSGAHSRDPVARNDGFYHISQGYFLP